MRQGTQSKPTIMIFASRDHGRAEALRQLLYGIEEESIPFEFYEKDTQVAEELAWEAAESSKLDVGIGFNSSNLVLCYEKMGEDRPLFVISSRSPEWQIRALGANAARLVKKLPFKSLDDEREVGQ